MAKNSKPLFDPEKAKDAHREISILVDTTVVTLLTVLISGSLVFLSKDSFANFNKVWPLNNSAQWLKLVLGTLFSLLLLHYLSLLTSRRSTHLLASGHTEELVDKARFWNKFTKIFNYIVGAGLAIAMLLSIYLIVAANYNFGVK